MRRRAWYAALNLAGAPLWPALMKSSLLKPNLFEVDDALASLGAKLGVDIEEGYVRELHT